MQETKKTAEYLPTIPLRGVVVFPRMIMHFDIAREPSIHAVEAAMQGNRRLFLATQKDVFIEEPEAQDIHEIGVIAEIKQTMRTSDESIRVLVQGLYRAKAKDMQFDGEMVRTHVQKLPLNTRETVDEMELTALVRALKNLYERYSSFFPRMPREVLTSVMCQDNPMQLYEAIVFNSAFDTKDKQLLLEEGRLSERLHLLYQILVQETQVLELEKEIKDRTQESIDQGQREYFLREQLRVISGQLKHETGEGEDDADSYAERILELGLPDESEEKLLKEANRLRHLPPASQESFVITSFLDTCLELPWHELDAENLDLKEAAETLDADHYGLQKVKERILESLAVRVLNPELKGQILCLVGPPGIGKSSIASSIAQAVGRAFVRVSLGGVRDEAEIRGHRKTYVGAMPGRIIAAMQQAKTRNPVLLLDEIDKMSNDYKGDPSAAMLEVLDSAQNHAFRDHYIEVPFDLSQVLFIATANTLDTIPKPLLDRMEIIELPSYTREEKFQIAKRHLVGKQLEAHGLKAVQCRFDDDALYHMIDAYTSEAGVRNLERTIAAVCRKTAKLIASGERKRVQVKKKDLKTYLGIEKFQPDPQSEQPTVGLVNGLAWTSVGGVLMPLEAMILDGKGSVELTGSLGNVMQESAKIAVSYARSVAKQYGIAADFHKTKDIHIHAPEGAVPKDGPSAGVTMTTALISALSGIPVRSDVAMTGEITLHGKVMPIGGLREKAMAAFKAGIRTVIMPDGNRPDLEEVDDVLKEHLTFVPVKHLSEVLELALVKTDAEQPAAGGAAHSAKKSKPVVRA